MNKLAFSFLILFLLGCNPGHPDSVKEYSTPSFTWNNATIYFLLTDRFNNGSKENDYLHEEDAPPAAYRGFMGGDIKGITAKIKSGYFSDLGVNAIWFTPVVDQIDASVDEGTGTSYAYHGYWTRDWTDLDERFGTMEDLAELVETAHENKIRVVIDVVANHTGPVTPLDSKWPDSWVKTGPKCTYEGYESTVDCTLVENLPDIRTEANTEVSLPQFLIEKWKKEGRYEREVEELDNWFEQTGYARTAVNYILKWLVDFIKEYGVDGFRVDTVKHTEGYVWKNLYNAATQAWENYKINNPEEIIDPNTPFYMVGEVYYYHISEGRNYNYGDTVVDFYDEGFDALINFDFKADAHNDYESIFSKYDSLLHGPMANKTVLNYISSHDDAAPFDLNREKAMESATKLLLTQGGTQIYYGDETARSLTVEANGDASLRSFMNWDELDNNMDKGNYTTKQVLEHWQKLGKFRNHHVSIGAGRHKMIDESPYTFQRTYNRDSVEDKVVVALDAKAGPKSISTGNIFNENEKLRDVYSGKLVTVKNGRVDLDTPYSIVLLEKE
jgi:alpha-amylase